jgi:hypothetical protein
MGRHIIVISSVPIGFFFSIDVPSMHSMDELNAIECRYMSYANKPSALFPDRLVGYVHFDTRRRVSCFMSNVIGSYPINPEELLDDFLTSLTALALYSSRGILGHKKRKSPLSGFTQVQLAELKSLIQKEVSDLSTKK